MGHPLCPASLRLCPKDVRVTSPPSHSQGRLIGIPARSAPWGRKRAKNPFPHVVSRWPRVDSSFLYVGLLCAPAWFSLFLLLQASLDRRLETQLWRGVGNGETALLNTPIPLQAASGEMNGSEP